MSWRVYSESMVTVLENDAWNFVLRSKQKMHVKYELLNSTSDWYELFGGKYWSLFSVTASPGGMAEIIRQYTDSDLMGGYSRIVHYQGGGMIIPHLLIAPAVRGIDSLSVSEITYYYRVWALTDKFPTEHVVAFGYVAATEGHNKRSGPFSMRMQVLPLKNQRLHDIPLTGDLRYLPLHELSRHIDRLVAQAHPLRPTRKRKVPHQSRSRRK